MSDRDRLVELLKNSPHLDVCYGDDRTYEKAADHLLSNGVIVPPCKVGDTVYRLDDVILYGECGHCEHYFIVDFGDPCKCERTGQPRKHPDCIEIVEKQIDYNEILLCLAYGDFGKTVFLTREEAEQALRERKK